MIPRMCWLEHSHEHTYACTTNAPVRAKPPERYKVELNANMVKLHCLDSVVERSVEAVWEACLP